jgi:hypothetical protein
MEANQSQHYLTVFQTHIRHFRIRQLLRPHAFQLSQWALPISVDTKGGGQWSEVTEAGFVLKTDICKWRNSEQREF